MLWCERNSEGNETGVSQVDVGGYLGLSESRWVAERPVPSKTRLRSAALPACLLVIILYIFLAPLYIKEICSQVAVLIYFQWLKLSKAV